jgi:peroxiredoxin Q/BCP
MVVAQVPYVAPGFVLSDADGVTRTLSDFKGSWVVLYFYPKDDTPGCTIEACSLRDTHEDLTSLGAKVVGISRDGAQSHEQFAAKYNLNFTLLSDPDAEVMKAYGAWGKKMFGQEGVLRKTFIIDPEGIVQKVYGRVTPLGHGKKVADDLKILLSK